MLWLTFALVAITSSGPFVFLARRFVRRLCGYPKVGDRLWAMLGVPWLLTAVIQSATGRIGAPTELVVFHDVRSGARAGLPGRAGGRLEHLGHGAARAGGARIEAAPWTNRVGLILAIAWPIQCGLGLVVLN